MWPWRKRWDYLIIVAAALSVFFIPVRFALKRNFGEPFYFTYDLITYIMYWADIFISLRTTYIDSFGEEIRDNKMIIKRYLSSLSFWIDLLSLLNYPTKGFQEDNSLNFFGILKAVRLARL